MIVKIKEYSFKTGKGVAVDSAGNKIDFSYREFQNEKAIPVGEIADMKNGIISPAKNKSILFWTMEKLRKVVKNANRNG